MEGGVPLVSYVLVNWRTEELLPRALASINAQTCALREIILVNNGSPSFDPQRYAKQAGIRLILNPRNLGFARANNQGINIAQGDFIVLLNCDAFLSPEFVQQALAVFATDERIGTVVPKILRDDDSGRIDSAGHTMYTDRTPAHRGYQEFDQGQYDYPCDVFGGSAAAVIYRRSMLEDVAATTGSARQAIGAVFDESFFSYFEDVDLDWRAQLQGWKARFSPLCLAWHRGHGSGGRKSLKIQLLAEKNRYLMLVKNDVLADQLADSCAIALYEAWHAVRTLFKPWLWPALLLFWWNLPAAWHYRLKAGSRRVLRPARLRAMFTPRGLQAPLLELRPADIGQSAALTAPSTEAIYPLVSVIVLNLDGLVISRASIASILEQSYQPLEVIVVDNGSQVDEARLLGVEFPEIRTLRLERNHGFSGGVNWGLTLARGEYIALINNDCICHQDCIRNLVYAQRRTQAPAVSGRLANVTTAEMAEQLLAALEAEAETAAGELMTEQLPGEIATALKESWRNHGRSVCLWHVHDVYEQQNECFDPSGGLCLLKRRAVQQWLPQLFPHMYFAYGEDLNLGIRLRAQGGWVAKEPRAAAAHIAHSTAQRMGGMLLRGVQERNRMLNVLGYYPQAVLWRLMPLLTLLGLGAACINLIKRPRHFIGWLGARIWIMLHPLWLRQWRKSCREEVRVPDEQWLGELSARHGSGQGLVSRFSLWYCRTLGIPHREAAGYVPARQLESKQQD